MSRIGTCSFRCAAKFGRYWMHSGHCSALALNGSVAIGVWRGEWLADFPKYRTLSDADKIAWGAWLPWKTFLRNHAEAIAGIDMCVVPTLTFDLLFAFLVQGHGRRQLLWFEVTRHPTAEWLARQITEAFPWASAPAYLVRDNDRAYGHVFTARVRAMGIRDRPISPGSPWQNGIAERLIGTTHISIMARVNAQGPDTLQQTWFETNSQKIHLQTGGGPYISEKTPDEPLNCTALTPI